MQCTSPFRQKGIIDNAIKKMIKEKADSLFFGHSIERWLWKNNKPINYDYKKRPMTQDKQWDIDIEGGDYIFTMDWENKKILLSPMPDPVIIESLSSFGFSVSYHEDKKYLYISEIYKNSAAYHSKLQGGDIIIELNKKRCVI